MIIFPFMKNGTPFSFRYGRKHSAQLLPYWDLKVVKNRLIWTDLHTGLQVHLTTKTHDTGAAEWFLEFTNTGDKPTPILEDVQACQIGLAGDIGWRERALLYRLHGSSAKETDFLPYTTEIKPGTWTRWGPKEGQSSSGACPFFAIQWSGGGVITAIGWTGQWKAQLAWGTKTELMVGMEYLHLSLMPGESIRSPSIVQLWWTGDEIPYNLFRKTMIDHILPRVGRELVMPPIAHLNTVCWEWNSGDEKSALEHLDSMEGLGFEVFWEDAYYFGKGGFPAGVGEYGPDVTSVVAKDRFPRGLEFISGKVHEKGMEFLLWYAPELAMPGTWMYEEHPGWLLSSEGREGKLLNLGNPEACKYITQYLIDSVKHYKLDWLRIDCAPAPLPYWQEADVDDGRAGLTEIRYVEGLYRMLDDILEACPYLKIDNCDGGGRRIDLEMCRRTVPLWRTDHTLTFQEVTGNFDWGAVLNQVQIAGLNRYVPLHEGGTFSEEPYWFRSAYNAGIGFTDDCRGKYYPKGVLKAAIEEAKRIRKYFLGNFYPLTEVTLNPRTWHVTQYHRPIEQDGMVLAFRRHESQDVDFACQLHEIDLSSKYEITRAYGYHRSIPVIVAGAYLRKILLEIGDCPGSVLLEYRRL